MPSQQTTDKLNALWAKGTYDPDTAENVKRHQSAGDTQFGGQWYNQGDWNAIQALRTGEGGDLGGAVGGSVTTPSGGAPGGGLGPGGGAAAAGGSGGDTSAPLAGLTNALGNLPGGGQGYQGVQGPLRSGSQSIGQRILPDDKLSPLAGLRKIY